MSDGLTTATLRAAVAAALTRFLDAQRPGLDAIARDLAPLMDALVALTHGGKRLRPSFCVWGYVGAGGAVSDALLSTATALELLQACAIVHDDVMDRSDTRRGQPAVHRRFAALHREQGWAGDPEAFGTGAAILLGDLCLSWADEMLHGSGLPAEPLSRARPVFDEMRSELMAGQYLDMLEQARGGGSVPRALRVIRYKSAKYTIEKPLHLGAALAGGAPEVSAAYSAYGLPLGEAFQLRDDVLGVFGDPTETGKPAGDDLREGKRTVLVALAAERASAADAALLRRHLGDPHLDAEGVTALRSLLVDTGALAAVEELIEARLAEALDALETSAVSAAARGPLAELAQAAVRRSA